MAKRPKPMQHGSELGHTLDLERDGVAVVNRSNRTLMLKDPSPPHHTIVMEAGNVALATKRQNCIRLFSQATANAFVRMAGDAIELYGVEDGVKLRQKARELGSFEAAYKMMRGEGLLDLSQTKAEIARRALIVQSLSRAGVRNSDIPDGASLADLQKLYQDTVTGRAHLKLIGLEKSAPIGDGTIRPISPNAPSFTPQQRELQELRERIDALGGAWHPGHTAPQLRESIAELEAAHAERLAAEADAATENA